MALIAAIAAAEETAIAAPAPAPATYTLTGNVGVVSDYRFRGISNTNRRPALQAGLEWAHGATALYVGVWGSTVAEAAFNHTDGHEFDAYAGWRKQLTDEWQIDTGLYTYSFPGAVIHHAAPSGRTTKVRYDTQEIKFGINYRAFNVTGWYSIGRYWSGFFRTDADGNARDIRGTNYIEANWNPDMGDGCTVNLHVGRQHFPGLGAADFKDVRIAITKVFDGGWQASAAVVRNDGSRAVYTFVDPRDRKGRYAAGNALILGVQRNF